MPEKTLEELQELVGTSVENTRSMQIEAGKVAEYARAVRNDDAVHETVSAAVERGHDAIPAPLTFTWTAQFPRYRPADVDQFTPFDLGFDERRLVHGQQRYEFARPVYVGDVLSSEMELVDVYQRDGDRGGTMTFAVLETVYRDAEGAEVVTERRTVIETGDGPGTEADE